MSAADAVYIANDPAAQARLREQEALLCASELADAQGRRVQDGGVCIWADPTVTRPHRNFRRISKMGGSPNRSAAARFGREHSFPDLTFFICPKQAFSLRQNSARASAAPRPAQPHMPPLGHRRSPHRRTAPPARAGTEAAGGRSATDNRCHGEVPSPTASVWGQGAPLLAPRFLPRAQRVLGLGGRPCTHQVVRRRTATSACSHCTGGTARHVSATEPPCQRLRRSRRGGADSQCTSQQAVAS
jgi:hypothetical protein